jgi:hypothetical protein
MRKKWIIAILAAALLALPGLGVNLAQAAPAYTGWGPAVDLSPLRPAGYAAVGIKGKYLAGDFHNHTTLSDGSTSIQSLISKSVNQFGLDWFGQSGHGGAWSRNGNFDDPNYDGSVKAPGQFWADTPGVVFKGDPAGNGYGGKQNMWKWQVIQEYLYPVTWQNCMTTQKPIWTGLEWQVPGHEHCSTGIITGQFTPVPGRMGNAKAMAQFEYLFDMEDKDTSEGGGQGWAGKIPNPAKTGTDVGLAGHAKAVAAAKWMQDHHKFAAYMVPAHVERKGSFNKDLGGNNTGYNVEHFRDLNNAGPDVCFGFEGQPGHQADANRGGFGTSAFGGTFGGTGYYSATIGNMWDALLGEGRNWWLFASSDWHSKDTQEYNSGEGDWLNSIPTDGDFWPGEYQKDYVFVKSLKQPTVQDVLNGMRGGNSFIVQGDLIRGLEFTAKGYGLPASMGEKLIVGPNQKVTIKVRVHVPDVNNNCPYAFDNPSLAQLNIHHALNRPVLHHVDLISGEVYGKVKPGDAKYTDPTNPTAGIKQTVLVSDMKDEGKGWKSFTFEFKPTKSCYFRLRGTNLPVNTPNETDDKGNPLADSLAKNIKYTHPPTLGPNTALDTDVEAWSDLWFYSNPIFVRVVGVKDAVNF